MTEADFIAFAVLLAVALLVRFQVAVVDTQLRSAQAEREAAFLSHWESER